MRWHIRRIAILDIDAHHGNGAQNIFWNDPEMLVASIHQRRLSFSTGDADECGAHNNILNLPLDPGAGSTAFRSVLRDCALPRLAAFKPEMILVAAGFDAHAVDPLSQLQLDHADFSWAADQIAKAASQLCQKRLVAGLEGGYDLGSLSISVGAFMGG